MDRIPNAGKPDQAILLSKKNQRTTANYFIDDFPVK